LSHKYNEKVLHGRRHNTHLLEDYISKNGSGFLESFKKIYVSESG
jgi:hypothetical protein